MNSQRADRTYGGYRREAREAQSRARSCIWLLILVLICMAAGYVLAATLTITAPSANARAGQGTSYGLVGNVTKDDQYEVLEERGGWYKLRLEDGTEGWVSGKVAIVNAASRGREGPPIPAATGQSGATASQRRLALVVGNAAYPDSPLRNPVNDASDMAALLRQLGFSVTLVRDGDKPSMERAIESCTRAAPSGTVGLFYFSGHGVQIEGVNYLVPVGATFTQASDVKYRAVSADWVLARMEEARMEVKLLILDACRDNPLGRSWTRTLSRGLASMEAVTGSLIAYATSPGKTAADGVGRNSPYTAALLRHLPAPGEPVQWLFSTVREAVVQETKGKQTPWYLDPFYIDAYEVTNALYGKFLQAARHREPSFWRDSRYNGPNQPVVGMGWDDADADCRWAGRRLPTEAEWEKAARGTDGRTYPWGSQWDPTRANTNNGGPGKPTPVGSYEGGKSPYGAYDMVGNVWEWVADWYDATYYRNSPSRNPAGPAGGQYRVLRGGSWTTDPNFTRAVFRNGVTQAYRHVTYGFRCAKAS